MEYFLTQEIPNISLDEKTTEISLDLDVVETRGNKKNTKISKASSQELCDLVVEDMIALVKKDFASIKLSKK